MFKLDDRIEQDSFLVKELNDFQIRIMDVREVFWVILIPTKINLVELSDLDIAVSYTHLTLPTNSRV